MSKKYIQRDFSAQNYLGCPCCIDDATCCPSKNACLLGTFCAPCVMAQAFEEQHEQFNRCFPETPCCPRTCLGCGLCVNFLAFGPWATAYIASHGRENVDPFETFVMCIAGSIYCMACYCVPCQVAGELQEKSSLETQLM